MDSQLLEAWCRTDYVVRLANQELIFRLGEANPANDELLKEQGINRWAVLTAWNPGSQPSSDDENNASHRRLVDELRNRKFSWSPGDGHPPDNRWPVERGCFIHNISTDDAAELCRQFGQLAAVVGRPGERPRLVFGHLDALRADLEVIAHGDSDDIVCQVARHSLEAST